MAPESMDTGRDEAERLTEPAFRFGEDHTRQFTTRNVTDVRLNLPDNQPERTEGSFLDQPATEAIDFQPDTAASISSNQSKADKARARTAKTREARAKKLKEAKSTSQDDTTIRKQAKRAAHLEKANHQAGSDLSSIDETNMKDLERQLRADGVLPSSSLPDRRSDDDFQPSSMPGETSSRKRKQPHIEDLSLNIRSAGKRKTHSRKLSQNKRQ
jgi:hypothetical protein